MSWKILGEISNDIFLIPRKKKLRIFSGFMKVIPRKIWLRNFWKDSWRNWKRNYWRFLLRNGYRNPCSINFWENPVVYSEGIRPGNTCGGILRRNNFTIDYNLEFFKENLAETKKNPGRILWELLKKNEKKSFKRVFKEYLIKLNKSLQLFMDEFLRKILGKSQGIDFETVSAGMGEIIPEAFPEKFPKLSLKNGLNVF